MNNQSFDSSTDSYSSNSCSTTQPVIKQEIMPISSFIPGNSRQILSSTANSQLDLSRRNEPIEYIPNDLDDDNIQGSLAYNCNNKFGPKLIVFSLLVVNVYTTHMPEISTTLPTIIMQDEAASLNNTTQSTDLALHNHLSLPSDSYSLIGEDLIKHSFSDEGSSGDQSDVEIDL